MPPWPPLPPGARVLILRLSAIGDVLVALPALRSLKRQRPDLRVSWAVEDRAADLLRGHPDLEDVVVYPRRRWVRGLRHPLRLPGTLREMARTFRELRRRRFDAALDLQGNLKSGLFGLLSGARLRVGFAGAHTREGNRLFNHRRIPVPPEAVHRVERDLALLPGIGLEPRYEPPVLPLDPEDARPAEELLARADGSGALVLLHPGTSDFGAVKRWPAERFGALGERLAREGGARVVVTWGPGEEELARAVVEASRGRAAPAPPLRSLRELAALIRRAALFVAADTGPLQIAAALRVPLVALFGPKDPAVYGPYRTGTVLYHGLPGLPSVRRDPHPSQRMENITVEEAFAASLRELRAR
jgi:lipopolysaccharide heptosyltransferase I